MMTMRLFNLLSKKEQADVLEDEGVYLYTRQEPEFVIDLYEIQGFFVEVYYHKCQKEFIIVKSFQSDEQPQSIADILVPQLTIAWKNPFAFDAKHGFA